MGKKIVAIVQARMGSTRLPGKVMLELAGRTTISHVIERCKAIPSVHEVMIATSDSPADGILVEEARRLGVRFFQGSETDLLSRYYEAAKYSQADVIVRITSDCPLIDPEISEKTIQYFMNAPDADYCSNVEQRTLPRGLDTEVFSYKALERTHLEAKKDYHREHVGDYMFENPNQFRIYSDTNDYGDFSQYRWTLDTPEDYELIQKIYGFLYIPGAIFTWKEAVSLMQLNPELALINADVEQKKYV
ncbi:glycosyltransferase family protein [Cohnella sp. NL03-T5]|nr:glycosyltransferase family protein [Cohnella silvisoli]